jgi:phosphonate transport system substrate-binding protein
MKPKQVLQTALAVLWVGVLSQPVWASPAQKAQGPDVTMGSVAMDIPVEMINLESAVEDLGTGQTQIAYLTPVAYIEARKKYGVVPLVAPTTQGRPHFSLVIGTKAGSGINTPAELKGKRFAFGDEKALLQRAAVASMGLTANDFSNFAYLKHYDNIAKAVLAGDFDGGILKDSVAEGFKSKGLVVIGSTAALPSYIFAVHPAMPVAVRNQLRDALLALKKSTPERAATLEAFDIAYDGFTPIEDSAYDPVRTLIQPFQK